MLRLLVATAMSVRLSSHHGLRPNCLTRSHNRTLKCKLEQEVRITRKRLLGTKATIYSGFDIKTVRNFTSEPSSGDLYSHRDEVRKWTTSDLSQWMQNNANISDKQIQVINANNLHGNDFLDSNISSFKQLRAKYPLATRELGRATQKFRLAFMVPTSFRQNFINTQEPEIPFDGCDAAIKRALMEVRMHAQKEIYSKSGIKTDQVRLGNTLLFAFDSIPGIGKTRFAKEFPKLLAERTSGELKTKLEKVRTVNISFDGDKKIVNEIDLKWKYFTERVNWILTSRAIHAVYDVQENYHIWANELSKLFGDDLPEYFNMEWVTENLIARDPTTTTLYFHVDEFHEVFSLPLDVQRHLVQTLSSIYAHYNQERLLTLLLFTGTRCPDTHVLLQKLNPTNFPLVNLINISDV